MKEYKIIQENNFFKSDKKAIEKIINKLAREGWEVISISFTSYYGAFATLAREIHKNELV